MTNTDVFTTSDVATICRVSTRIVTKWFDTDILGGYRLPGSLHRRFTATNIRDFMSKQNMPIEWLDEAIEVRLNGKPIKNEEEVEAIAEASN